MKLLVLSSNLRSLINFRLAFLQKLLHNGHEIIAGAPCQNTVYEQTLVKHNITTNYVPLSKASINPLCDLLYLFKLISLIRREKPKAVFAYTMKPVIFGMLAAHITRRPFKFVMITGLGYSFAQRGLKHLTLRILLVGFLKVVLKNVDAVFFQNSDDLRYFKLHNIGPKNKCFKVNGSGVDLKAFPYIVKPVRNEVQFLMVSRLIKAKGILEFCKAAKRSSSLINNCRWKIVGGLDGDNPDSLSQIELAFIRDETPVELVDYTDNVLNFYRACDIFVLPSYREGLPRSVLEAMAVGRAIITTNVPGCRETVENNRNGILVEPRSVNKLEEAMVKLATDKQLIMEMGKESRKIAESKFCSIKVSEDMYSKLPFL